MGTLPRWKTSWCATLIASLTGACAAARPAPVDVPALVAPAAPIPPGPAGAPAPDSAADEAALADAADLEVMRRVLRARNPELAAAVQRVRARAEVAPAASRLPDPELKLEQMGAPMTRPWALDEAMMVMVGVRQMVPPSGARSAEGRAAVEEVRIAAAELRRLVADLDAQLRKAHAEYLLATEEVRVHVAHQRLLEQAVALVRASYRAGRGRDQDVLRLALEEARLGRDLAGLDQRVRSAAARLNLLMGRAADAPLGPPSPLTPSAPGTPLADLERLALERRPELAAAGHAVARREAMLAGARSAGRAPSLMVGLDYMYMPHEERRHGYGAMVSLSLPWLNPQHGERIRGAARDVDAERRAHDSARNQVQFEVHDAYARVRAAADAFVQVDRQVVPRAEQVFEAAQAAYGAGRGDGAALLEALRTILDVRLDDVRAAVELEERLADLERAVGAPIERAPLGGTEDDR